jgi:uncharacterized protein
MNVLALGVALLLQSPALPALTGRVVDNAEVLSSSEEASLTDRLATIENETSVQIVVVTIPTLGGEPIEDFSIRLADLWKIGQAGLDNGVILLVVPSERRVRIEVGYGLEAVIPDGLAGRIIRERLAPSFREENYYAGLLSAIDGLELAARREYPEAPPTSAEPTDIGLGGLFFGYLVLGGLGNAFGVVVAIVGGAVLFWVLGGSIAQMLGWWSIPVGGLLGLVATLMLRSSGRKGGWTHYGGSGRSSGGWSSGGGGGFSGGGGSFGGGGASGSW